jgi:hypothetical protein
MSYKEKKMKELLLRILPFLTKSIDAARCLENPRTKLRRQIVDFLRKLDCNHTSPDVLEKVKICKGCGANYGEILKIKENL